MSKMKENIIIAVSVSICALFVTTIALLALWWGCPTICPKFRAAYVFMRTRVLIPFSASILVVLDNLIKDSFRKPEKYIPWNQRKYWIWRYKCNSFISVKRNFDPNSSQSHTEYDWFDLFIGNRIDNNWSHRFRINFGKFSFWIPFSRFRSWTGSWRNWSYNRYCYRRIRFGFGITEDIKEDKKKWWAKTAKIFERNKRKMEKVRSWKCQETFQG